MGDENPIRTLGDYSKPSYEGYRNTIELPARNNVEIIENLALYDHEGWDETKEFVKPVKAISKPQGVSKTPNQILLEIKDQINFLLKRSRPTPTSSSVHTSQAYVNIVHLNSFPRNQNKPPKLNTFTFREHTCPSPQPQALETTFEARIQDYMAAHTERMERFTNAIFKQRELIDSRMTEMFRLLKELTTNKTPKKALIREEAKFFITNNVNPSSLTKGKEEISNMTKATPENTEKPTTTEAEMPLIEAETNNEAKNEAKNK
nr:hypothetical protein [Tanacetum cinerariifolium]